MRKIARFLLVAVMAIIAHDVVLAQTPSIGVGKMAKMPKCVFDTRGSQYTITNASIEDSCDNTQPVGVLVSDCECQTEDDITWAWAASASGSAAASAPRVVNVYVGATDVEGVTYNTIKEAADYIATQTPTGSTRWQIRAQGGGTFTETAFTLPVFTDLVCEVGGYTYFAYDGLTHTLVTGAITTGAFISMEGNSSIRNCVVSATGNSTAPRTVVDCLANSGLEMCYLDHVGVYSDESGASTQEDVGVAAVAGSNGVLSMYYVVVGMSSSNVNSIGVKVGAANTMQFDNGLVNPGGAANGKGIQALTNSPFYSWIKNVSVIAPYSLTGWTTAISEEGTGTFYSTSSSFRSASGSVTILDGNMDFGVMAAPPTTCAASAVGWSYTDSDIAKKCVCNGTNFVLANDDSTTTGCS